MQNIIFFFGGTGAERSGFKEVSKKLDNNVIKVHLKGHYTSIGGTSIEGAIPDLDIGAKNIRNAFNNSKLNLTSLLNIYGDAIVNKEELKQIENQLKKSTLHGQANILIDSIGMAGISRGAVSCYSSARQLNDLNIPMDIFADQPVPGNSNLNINTDKSEFFKNCDLTKCNNIRWCGYTKPDTKIIIPIILRSVHNA